MPKTTPPADADQAPAEQPAAPPAPSEASPEPRFWRYSGPERLYAHIPVTVRDGDVIEYMADTVVVDGVHQLDAVTLVANQLDPGAFHADLVARGVDSHTEPAPPAYDGHWERCDGPATVRPDNHPREHVDEVTDNG